MKHKSSALALPERRWPQMRDCTSFTAGVYFYNYPTCRRVDARVENGRSLSTGAVRRSAASRAAPARAAMGRRARFATNVRQSSQAGHAPAIESIVKAPRVARLAAFAASIPSREFGCEIPRDDGARARHTCALPAALRRLEVDLLSSCARRVDESPTGTPSFRGVRARAAPSSGCSSRCSCRRS